MDKLQGPFIRDIAHETVTAEWKGELPYLNLILDEMQANDYLLPQEMAGEFPAGLGADDIVAALRSPAVIAVLASLWTTIVAPLIKDVLKHEVLTRLDSPEARRKRLHVAVFTYLSKELTNKPRGKRLSEQEVDRLAARIVKWVEHKTEHPQKSD